MFFPQVRATVLGVDIRKPLGTGPIRPAPCYCWGMLLWAFAIVRG